MYPDGHKCWAVTPPLYKLHHAKAAARMAWLSNIVDQSVVYDVVNQEVIERYDGKSNNQ